MDSVLPLTTSNVRVAVRAMFKLMVSPFVRQLLVTPPPSLSALPQRVKAPAVLLKVMPLNAVLAAILLVFVSRVVPSKNSRSLATGAVPPQLVAVFQLLSTPPPVHVRLAAGALPAQSKEMLPASSHTNIIRLERHLEFISTRFIFLALSVG